jgi:hypothetical protein
MARIAAGLAMAVAVGSAASGFQNTQEVLERFLTRMKAELGQLPDYVCTQTIERLNRASSEVPWRKADTLRFDVALVGDRELYGPPGGRQFHERPLSEVVGRGTVSTGRLGVLAKHVFADSAAQFTYKGETEQDGRAAHEYTFDVPVERSNYRLRSASAEMPVSFQGTFWFDKESLDLIRLEVQAYDIPHSLGLAEANTALTYSRVSIDGGELLLPSAGSLFIATVDSLESLNRMKIGDCRHYRAESTLRFETETASSSKTAAPEVSSDLAIPAGTLVELTLETPLDPATMNVGDVIKARVLKAIRSGDRTLVPEGAVAFGHLVRLESESIPFPMFQVGLAFESLEISGQTMALTLTMEDAGPHAGLIRQAKRMDPTFTKRRSPRLDILVREVQTGQGFLHWDARKGPIPRGLHTKWRVAPPKNAPSF